MFRIGWINPHYKKNWVYIHVHGICLIVSIPVAASVGLVVTRICPKWSTINRHGKIGPIRDIIKSVNNPSKSNTSIKNFKELYVVMGLDSHIYTTPISIGK